MQIRQLAPSERLEASRISLIAFHERCDDLEARRAECERSKDEDWGAFTDEGELMARIINNHYTIWLDGHEVSCGGIGAVSTLPEYRESGAIRAIFAQLLPFSRAQGQVLSALYPFNHAFYRKFGYETINWRVQYTFRPEVLKEYRFSGAARQFRPGDTPTPYTNLHNRFAASFNLPARRTDAMMADPHLAGVDYKDRKFSYLLSVDDTPVSYVIFTDEAQAGQRTLSVYDCAWDGRAGWLALLGFLARFTADYAKIRICLPRSIDFINLLHSPYTYDVTVQPMWDYMLRVVNVPKALAAMRHPARGCFTICVQDDLLPDNCGTWTIFSDSITPVDAAPDLTVDVRALAQLIAGAIDLNEALLRADVTLHTDNAALREVFVRRPIYMAEHF